jgi:hypothetical protein
VDKVKQEDVELAKTYGFVFGVDKLIKGNITIYQTINKQWARKDLNQPAVFAYSLHNSLQDALEDKGKIR